mgnify:FL=1
MKNIKITINNARILSYEVELGEDYPDVTARIGLFAGEKMISTFALSTKTWQDTTFELPFQMIKEINAIAEQLETVLVHECNASFKLLSEPENK